MGVTGPETYLMEDFGVMPTETYNTSAVNVFIAGDFRRGQSLVILGILEGRKAAERVDEYLLTDM